MSDAAEKELPSVRAVKPDGTRTTGTWIADDRFLLDGWDVDAGDEIEVRDERWRVAEVDRRTIRGRQAQALTLKAT